MPNPFAPVEAHELASVTGGLEIKAWFRQLDRERGGQTVNRVTVRQSPYEKCLGDVTAKASWTPEQLKGTCGMPPTE